MRTSLSRSMRISELGSASATRPSMSEFGKGQGWLYASFGW